MPLTVSTPYKTNTVASVSGTTFNSNGTPFAVGDVGRFIRLTTGAGAGQIRRIESYVDTDTVVVDSAWNVSPIAGFTDVAPSAGDTWHMSYTLDDIDNGVDLIKRSSEAYEHVSSGSVTVTLTGCFVADVQKSLVLNADYFKISTDACLMLGRLHPSGYAESGGCLIDRSTGSFGGWAAINSNGNSGDLHLYGVNVQATPSGNPFWRLYRGSSHIVRFVDCDFSGNTGGRYQGTKSCIVRCTYRSGTSGTAIGMLNPIAPFGLIQGVTLQNLYQAIYVNYALGVGTITGPRFSDIGNRCGYVPTSVAGGAYTLEDYIQSEIEAAPAVVIFASTVAGNFLDFKQYVDTSIVDASLSAVTDASRRVIRNGAASVVDNVTTTSGTFSRYTAHVKRFPMVSGTHTWASASAVSYGPYQQAVASYLYRPQTLSLPLPTSSNVTFTMLADPYITETNKATVDAYADISDVDRLYDRYKSWFVDNLSTAYPSFGAQKLNGDGAVLDCGDANVTIDATAGSAFAVNTGTNTITVKASTLLAGASFTKLVTTGTISFVNGAAPGPLLVYRDATATSVPIIVGGVRNGTKVRVVRTDTSAELAIGTAGASGYTARVNWTSDIPIRADTAYVSGLDAEQEASALGTLTNVGAQLTIVQSPCAIYEGNAIDGSAVTGLTLDAPNVEIDADEADNYMTVQEIYAWYKVTLMTEAGIRTLFGAITPVNAHKYRVNASVVPLKIDQKDLVNSLVLAGGQIYRDDGEPLRLAGSGVIEFDVGDVYESQAAETALAAIKANTDELTQEQIKAWVDEAVFAKLLATGWSFERAVRKVTAVACSKTAGNTPTGGTVTIRTLNDDADELSAVVDSNGNRTSVSAGA